MPYIYAYVLDGKVEKRDAFRLVLPTLRLQKEGYPLASLTPSDKSEQKDFIMNKKEDKSLIRDIHYLVRLNQQEDRSFKTNLAKAQGMKSTDFIRKMISTGHVIVAAPKAQKMAMKEEHLKLVEMLDRYQKNFTLASNLIKENQGNHEWKELIAEAARACKKIADKL